jgi:hypothetical protein
VFIRVLFFAVLAMQAIAQDSRAIPSVKGTVLANESLAGNHLIVKLVESMSHKQVSRSYVGGDGGFEFHDVPARAGDRSK